MKRITSYPLKSLDIYILRQMTTPLIFGLVAVTGVVWLTQSLQRVDILVEHGEGFGTFAWLTVLIIPSLLSIIIPFALFGAILYAMQRLHADSEIAVMFAAGVSKMRIAMPILFVTTIGALLTLWINVDLMPRSYRSLKIAIAEIRADFATAVLRPGEFIAIGNGFTVYAEEARPGGQFVGLMIHDYRNGENAETYMAQRGLMRETSIGPILHLRNGNIQSVDEETGTVDIIQFAQTALNLSEFTTSPRDLQLELTERYIGELFNPDMSVQWDIDNRGRLIAEGHARLAAPLYAFAYMVIAMLALVGGSYNRRGYFLRIAGATILVGILCVSGFLIQSATASNGYNSLQYALPLLVIIVGTLVLLDIGSKGNSQRQIQGSA